MWRNRENKNLKVNILVCTDDNQSWKCLNHECILKPLEVWFGEVRA